ncbi:hypothetical protein TNCV_2242561 [Trichonephila clavipes]|nr:hypothetical protein TNCV_2242561 [Trichonephila clavipes]
MLNYKFDGPRNFEPHSSNDDGSELVSPSPNFHTTPTGGLRALIDLKCIIPSPRKVFEGIRSRAHGRPPGRRCFCQILVSQDPSFRGMYVKSVEAESWRGVEIRRVGYQVNCQSHDLTDYKIMWCITVRHRSVVN